MDEELKNIQDTGVGIKDKISSTLVIPLLT